MFDLESKRDGPFPVERAVLLSLVGHVLLFVLFLSAPPRRTPADPRKGLLAAFIPPEREEVPIPVEFRESTGPRRENPKPSPLSDLDRRAGGGDPRRARSDTPFVPERPGIAGLEEGRRGVREPAAPGTAREAESAAGTESRLAGGGSTERPAGEAPFFSAERPAGAGKGPPLVGLDRAIRDAARGTIGGDEGGGLPNPDGGFVDSGPLSFDTTWYDWGPYAAEMVRRIKLHWEIPGLARLGWKGKVTIRFFILSDGRVEDARIVSPSGVPPFDFAALQAILKSSPFLPLPTDLGSPREGVTVTFFYNIRPGREGQTEGTR